MIAQRTMTNTVVEHNNEAAVQEAIRLLTTQTLAQRWICERCGTVHTVATPDACEGCGATRTLVQQSEVRREINSRW